MYNIDASLWLGLLTEWFHILKNIGMACQSKTPPLSAFWLCVLYTPAVQCDQKIKIRMPSQEFNTERITFGM